MSKQSPLIVGAIGAACILALGALWTRGDRVLGNDSFGYLELAKQFRDHPPTHFGDWWPFGFPLLGTLFSFTGASVYVSLVLVSGIAMFAMIVLFWSVLPENSRGHPAALAILFAGVCAPVCPLSAVTLMSEPLFSALLFALAITLSRWPARSAIATSMLLATIAFTVRYVGAFTFVVVALYGLLSWQELRRAGCITFFGVTCIAAAIVAGILCYTNYRYSGRVTGPQLVGHESLASWPVHLADFGWSPVSAFISSGALRWSGGILKPATMTVGFASVSVIAFGILHSWARPHTPAIRPMVLLIGCYLLAIVTLRAITPFDAVSSARTFLPILFPLAYLLIVQSASKWQRMVMTFSTLSIFVSTLLAIRGMSPEVKTDISAVRVALGTVLEPGHKIAVNGEARSLAAYFPNRFYPLGESDDGLTPFWETTEHWDVRKTDFTVLMRPFHQAQSDGMESKMRSWEASISIATNLGRAKIIRRDDSFILLERTR